MSSAIKGHNDRNPDDKVDATKLLEKLGDRVGGAVADTLFKNAGEFGGKMIQNSINKQLPKDKSITVGGGIGSQTYAKLQEIAKDPKKTQSFLESLALQRVLEEDNGKNEKPRIYHRVINR
jgi:hypothetical protein